MNTIYSFGAVKVLEFLSPSLNKKLYSYVTKHSPFLTASHYLPQQEAFAQKLFKSLFF